MKGMILFISGFAVIIAASMAIANYDGLAVSVTEARAGTAMDMTTAFALETLINWILKAAVGGIFTGASILAYREVSSLYRTWKRNGRRGRWVSGPNANFQRTESVPKLTRSDLMLLALTGKELPQKGPKQRNLSREDFPDDDFGMMEF